MFRFKSYLWKEKVFIGYILAPIANQGKLMLLNVSVFVSSLGCTLTMRHIGRQHVNKWMCFGHPVLMILLNFEKLRQVTKNF